MTAPDHPLQIILSALWSAFGPAHAAPVLGRLATLSRNPFKWHTVIQGLTHASTWQGTALAYRMLIGTVLLGETTEAACDSHCEYCGHHSSFQTTVKAFHTALNYPKISSSQSSVSFANKFIAFFMHVLTNESSPVRHRLGELIAKVTAELKPESQCPLALFPDLLRVLDLEYREFFFAVLCLYFPPESDAIASPSARRKRIPSVSSFLVLLGAKGYESVTVEGGREFDTLMIEAVIDFTSSLPAEVLGVATQHSPRAQVIALPQQVATSLINVIKHSLVSMFLPPVEWMANFAFDQQNAVLKDVNQLQRCRQFMEPSAVLSVIRHMITQPGAIPDLTGSNEDKFNYHIGDIKIRKFDIDRSICVVKSVKTSGSPLATPSEGAVFARQVSGSSQSAQLILTVKEVHVEVEHSWRLDWNLKRNGSYYGKNVVKVTGLSSQIVFTIHPDDRGTVVESAKISLGLVEHNCNILNSNFISEFVAQAALDWFAEPLTRLLQTASQSAIEEFLKTANVTFRLQVWNGTVLKLFPQNVIGQMLQSLNDHLPKHGVPL